MKSKIEGFIFLILLIPSLSRFYLNKTNQEKVNKFY